MKNLLCTAALLSLLSACGTVQNSAGSLSSAGSAGSAGSANSAGSSGGSSAQGSSGSSFGGRNEEAVEAEEVVITDPRAYIPAIKSAKADKTKGGVILRVVGSIDRVGYHDLELVLSDQSTPSVLHYDLRAASPTIGLPTLTERSKEVQVAVFISDFTSPNARSIIVKGLNNTITVRR